ncbi:MAG: hypothetical protein M1827_005822 [Pycnora praestabilis]|nr:MAG: hypothetical protein M1827_005822 [Pycnora praestabilis]
MSDAEIVEVKRIWHEQGTNHLDGNNFQVPGEPVTQEAYDQLLFPSLRLASNLLTCSSALVWYDALIYGRRHMVHLGRDHPGPHFSIHAQKVPPTAEQKRVRSAPDAVHGRMALYFKGMTNVGVTRLSIKRRPGQSNATCPILRVQEWFNRLALVVSFTSEDFSPG